MPSPGAPRRLYIVAALVVVAIGACTTKSTTKTTVIKAGATSAAIGDRDAIAACEALVTPSEPGVTGGATSVAAGYDSTVGQVNRWRHARFANLGWQPDLHGDPSNGRDLTSTAKEVACFLNGNWEPSAPPGAGPFTLAPAYIGPTGTVMGDGVGNPATVQIERPSDHPGDIVPAPGGSATPPSSG